MIDGYADDNVSYLLSFSLSRKLIPTHCQFDFQFGGEDRSNREYCTIFKDALIIEAILDLSKKNFLRAGW